MPYWDWTELPQIPDGMFDGVLTPTDKAFAPYTGNLALFTSFIKPAMSSYWDSLSPAQLAQQNLRGYKKFEDVWNDVTGYSDVAQDRHFRKRGIRNNVRFPISVA